MSCLDKLSLLISLMKLFDKRDESRVLNLLYHEDTAHLHCHLALSFTFLCCFSADLLFLIPFLSNGGRSFILHADPSAAFLASASAIGVSCLSLYYHITDLSLLVQYNLYTYHYYKY